MIEQLFWTHYQISSGLNISIRYDDLRIMTILGDVVQKRHAGRSWKGFGPAFNRYGLERSNDMKESKTWNFFIFFLEQ